VARLTTNELKVADECWIALATLVRDNPQRSAFPAREIIDMASRMFGTARPGWTPHIYQHNVANVAPSSATYRMFSKVTGGYRLYRKGDPVAPGRSGKLHPDPEDLPDEYRPLVDWYLSSYHAARVAPQTADSEDSLLRLIGVGKDMWKEVGGGEAYIRQMRESWGREEATRFESEAAPTGYSESELFSRVWKRIRQHEDEVFETKTGRRFRYRVEGRQLRVRHAGPGNDKEVPIAISGGAIEESIRRCPLDKVKDVGDFFDPSYIYGILMDSRVRGEDW